MTKAEDAAEALLDAALLVAALHDPTVVITKRSMNQHRARRWLVKAALEYGRAQKEANGG